MTGTRVHLMHLNCCEEIIVIIFNLISCLVQNIYVKGDKILRASLVLRSISIKLKSSYIRTKDTYPKTSGIV